MFKEEDGLKKLRLISSLLSLMIILGGCSHGNQSSDDIYDKIHDLFYDIKSYNTNCEITTYTKAGQNTYECDVRFNSKDNSYLVTSEDMKIHLTDDKTIITKGANTIESPSVEGDMYIFINTFFKSYYESEDTAVSVSAGEKQASHMLECSAVNPTNHIASMKLWLDTKTVMPQKMHVIDSEGNVTYEIMFKNFTFEIQK